MIHYSLFIKKSYLCGHRMTATRQHIKWFLAAELLAFLLVAVVTCCCMPLAQAARMTIALAVAYALPCWFYHRGDHATPLGHGVLLVAALWLAAIAIPFVWQCTIGSGASFTMPQLIGDANDYYNWALAQYDGSSVKPKVTFWGYSILIVALWKVLGVNVIWPVVMNVMATLSSALLSPRFRHICTILTRNSGNSEFPQRQSTTRLLLHSTSLHLYLRLQTLL